MFMFLAGSRWPSDSFGKLCRRPWSGRTRVLIYGAGDGGEFTAAGDPNNRDLKYSPVDSLMTIRPRAVRSSWIESPRRNGDLTAVCKQHEVDDCC